MVALGAIAAHLAFAAHAGSALSNVCALGAALAAAGFYAVARRKISQIPLEAVIGVSYAITAAGALFLIGVAPGGHVHVQHMLAGSILWTSLQDVLVCVLVFTVVGGCFYLLREPFGRISADYTKASREGMKVAQWDLLFYGLVSVVITLAVRIGGVVLVFAFLIIPATISALFSSRWRARLAVAWAAGVLGSVLGLLFAERLDFSVGPAVALLLGIMLILAGISRVCRPLLAAAAAFCVFGGYIALLGTTGRTGTWLPRSAQDTPRIDASAVSVAELPVVHPGPADQDPMANLEQIGTVQDLVVLFGKTPHADRRSAIVCRALELDPRVGARMALGFLKDDPPLFFRQVVVDKLSEAAGERFGFEVVQPCTAPANMKAAREAQRRFGLPTE